MVNITQQASDLAVRIATELKSVRSSIGSLPSLSTTDKTNIVAAINEVAAALGSAGASIDDNATNLTTVWSSSKVSGLTTALRTDVDAASALAASKAAINDVAAASSTTYSSTKIESIVNAATAALVDGAPEALNTLNELAAALGDAPDAITAINTALGLRVRVDAAQAFDATQQARGRTNIGAASAAALGDPDAVDLVNVFETALL